MNEFSIACIGCGEVMQDNPEGYYPTCTACGIRFDRGGHRQRCFWYKTIGSYHVRWFHGETKILHLTEPICLFRSDKKIKTDADEKYIEMLLSFS